MRRSAFAVALIAAPSLVVMVLLLVAYLSGATGGTFLGSAVAGVVLVFWLSSALAARQPPAGEPMPGDAEAGHPHEPPADPQAAELLALTHHSLPIWQRELRLAQETGNDAVNSLTSEFGNLVDLLSHTLAEAEPDENEKSVSVIFKDREKLSSVIAALKDAQENRGHILEGLGQLDEQIQSLTGMASQVVSLSDQTNLLALNAAIEAARAGEAGRGFAVVAEEVRSLAMSSQKTAKQMTDTVAELKSGVARTVETVSSAVEKEDELLSEVQGQVSQINNDFTSVIDELQANTAYLKEQAGKVQQAIGSSLVLFQFQDRVSQIIAHSIETLHELEALAAALADGSGTDIPELNAWLQGIRARYTMESQHKAAAGERWQKSNSESDITFF